MLALLSIQRPALRDAVPFREARAAARARCVLGDEHRVAAEWGLLPVVPGMCRGEPLVDEVSPVVEDGPEAFRRQVAAFLGPEPEAPAE